VEGQVYPGNSGSPVWISFHGGLVILGVLAFAYPTEERSRAARCRNKRLSQLRAEPCRPD
jgi:V8-like Glu-specific endopeptidase